MFIPLVHYLLCWEKNYLEPIKRITKLQKRDESMFEKIIAIMRKNFFLRDGNLVMINYELRLHQISRSTTDELECLNES